MLRIRPRRQPGHDDGLRRRRALVALGRLLGFGLITMTTPAFAAERKTMVDTAEIARRFQASEPALAARIRDPRTTAEEVPMPFLKPSQRLVEVITRTGRYPTKFPVLLEGDRAIFLADRPDELKRVARESGFLLETPAAVVAYVAMLLRLGQPYSRRLVVLNRFTDVPLMTNPSPEERARYDALAAKYANVIGAPVVAVKDNVANGTAYVVRAQALERVTFSVHVDGRADIAQDVLEPDLPIDLQT